MKSNALPRTRLVKRFVARVIPNDPRALSIVQTLPGWQEKPAYFAVYVLNSAVPPYVKETLLNGFNSKAYLADFCGLHGIALAPAVGEPVQSPDVVFHTRNPAYDGPDGIFAGYGENG